MKKLATLGVFVAIFIMAFSFSALATPITILNNTFDDPTQGPGIYTINGINDWTTIATATDPRLGVWYPIASQTGGDTFINGIPDKPQIGYTNGADIEQTLSDSLIAGYRYTLKVWIGGRPGLSGIPYAVILAGGSQLGQITGMNTVNEWTEMTLTYDSPFDDPNAGQLLKIKIINNAGGQLDFDKVTLDGTPLVTCTGFLPPFDKPLTLKKKDNRAIPVKMMLRDLDGNIMTDADIPAPVVNVTFGGAPANIDPGYNEDLVPGGLADIGNAFRYDPTEHIWIINLATKQFTSHGEYTVTAKVGAYTIDGCIGTFTRLP
jgi:hypothetical protein